MKRLVIPSCALLLVSASALSACGQVGARTPQAAPSSTASGPPGPDKAGVIRYNPLAISYPAPSGAAARYPETSARAAAQKQQTALPAQMPGTPDVALREVGLDNVRSLAWVFTWHGSKLVLFGSGKRLDDAKKAAEGANCDRVLMFDADDGTELYSAQICG